MRVELLLGRELGLLIRGVTGGSSGSAISPEDSNARELLLDLLVLWSRFDSLSSTDRVR